MNAKTPSSNASSFPAELQRWTLVGLAVVAFVSAIASAVVIGRFIEQWATEQIETSAALAATRGGFLILAGNKTEAMFVLDGFEATPGVKYASFVASNGAVLAERRFGEVDEGAFSVARALPVSGSESVTRTVNGDHLWEIWARVDTVEDRDSAGEQRGASEAVGWLHIVWDGSLLGQVTGLVLVVTVGIALLVGTGMAWVMRRIMTRITQPVIDTLEAQLDTINAHASDLEAQVKSRTQALEDAMGHTETLMMTLTHDMRTPIHSVVGYLKFARDEVEKLKDAGAAQECLDSAERACVQLMEEVQKVIDFARLEAGAVSITTGYINLAQFARRIETMFAPLAKQKQNQLAVLIPAQDMVGFVSDEEKLEHIVRNLLSNACKFTSGGSIQATFELAHGKFTCRVVDTGIGIPKQESEAMFTQFWQENSPREGFEKGAGLGLFISSRFTELLGGTLSVEARENTGSEFTFTVPVEIPHRPGAAEDNLPVDDAG